MSNKAVSLLINRLCEKLPITSGSSTFLSKDIVLIETIFELFEQSKANYEDVLTGLVGLLCVTLEAADHQKKSISLCLVLRILSYCSAYHWRDWISANTPQQNYKPVGEPLFSPYIAYSSGSEKEAIKWPEHSLYPLTTLPDPLPKNEAQMAKLLKAITPFLSMFSADVNWEAFPYIWPKGYIKSNKKPRNFFMTVFSNQTTYNVIQDVLKISDSPGEILQESRKAASQLLFFISSANWPVILNQLRINLEKSGNYLVDAIAEVIAGGSSSPTDLGFIRGLEYCNLNRTRLISVIEDIPKVIASVHHNDRFVISVVIKNIIGIWIDDYPEDFSRLVQKKQNLSDKLEPLFDILHEQSDSSHKKDIFYPTMMMLYLISCKDCNEYFQTGSVTSATKKKSLIPPFLDALKKAFKSKSWDMAAYCYSEICHAASVLSESDGYIFRGMMKGFESDLRDKLFDITKEVKAKDNTSYVDEVLLQNCVATLGMTNWSSYIEFEQSLKILFSSLFNPACPLFYKSVLIVGVKHIIQKNYGFSLTKPPVDYSIAVFLRQTLLQAIKRETPAKKEMKKSFGSFNTLNEGKDKKDKKGSNEEADRNNIIANILEIYSMYPIFAFAKEKNAIIDHDELKVLLREIVCLVTDSGEAIKEFAMKTICRLFDPLIVPLWNGCVKSFELPEHPEQNESEATLSYFWKISSMTMLLITRKILQILVPDCPPKGIQTIKELGMVCSHLMHYRIMYLKKRLKLAQTAGQIPERFASNVSIEVTFLLLLNCIDLEVARVATHNISLIVDENTTLDPELKSKLTGSRSGSLFDYNEEVSKPPLLENITAYAEIQKIHYNAPWPSSLSPKVYHKSIRAALRLCSKPTPGIMGAWEEVYRRWKSLYSQMIGANPNATFSPTSSLSSVADSVADEESKSKKNKLGVQKLPDTKKEVHQEWNSYTGFLFALSNMCLSVAVPRSSIVSAMSHQTTASQRPHHHLSSPSILETESDTTSIDEKSSWMNSVNEQLKVSLTHAQQVVEKFNRELFDLTLNENVMMRESVKELLGYEMSGPICSYLFQFLETQSNKIIDNNNAAVGNDKNMIFVDSVLTLTTFLLNRAESLFEGGETEMSYNTQALGRYSMDLGLICLNLTLFANNVVNEDYRDKIKLRISNLIILLIQKRELVGISQENIWRNRILGILMEWNSVFNLKDGQHVQLDAKKIMDLDQATLKAMKGLLENLYIQPISENMQINTDKAAKAKLFVKYFRFFLKALDSYKVGEVTASNDQIGTADYSKIRSANKHLEFLKNETILALSTLISANMDIGIKHTLSIAYDQDPMLRRIFVQVLTNILKFGSTTAINQGDQAESSNKGKYAGLMEYILQEPYYVLQSLAEACNFNETEDMVGVLLDIFEQERKTISLIAHFARSEIFNTEDAACIFRRNSVASKILSLYSKAQAKQFMDASIGHAFTTLLQNTTKISYEIDSTKLAPDENLQTNTTNLRNLTELFLNGVINNSNLLPKSFKLICSYIYNFVGEKFPGSEKLAIGGLIFLRICCPAMVAPELYGVTPGPVTNKELRRGLVLASKIIQNLANNVLFGNKETYMIPFNSFLEENRERVDNFFMDLAKVNPDEVNEDTVVPLSKEEYTIREIKLHGYLAQYISKIEASGTNVARPLVVDPGIPEEIQQHNDHFSWKSAVETVSMILGDLGPVPVLESATKPVQAKVVKPIAEKGSGDSGSSALAAFLQVNSTNANYVALLEKVRQSKLFYISNTSLENRPVFYYNSSLVIPVNMDLNALLYCILAELKAYLNAPLDVVVDLTMYSSDNEWPQEILSILHKILPSDSKSMLHTLIFVNANTYFRLNLKKYSRILNNKFAKRVAFVTSLQELNEYIAPEKLTLHPTTMDIFKQSRQTYTAVNQYIARRKDTPVSFSFSPDVVQIIGLKKVDFLGFQGATADFYKISQVQDVGQDDGLSKAETFGQESLNFYRTNEQDDKKQYDFFMHVEAKVGVRTNLYFNSTQRDSILQSLQSAVSNARLAKFTMTADDRVLSPRDLPGTLLNIAFTNLNSSNGSLRATSYNLLCAIVATAEEKSKASQYLKTMNGNAIPSYSHDFIIKISRELAKSEKHLTFEFLSESLNSFSKYEAKLKHCVLHYISPWLDNLEHMDAENKTERLEQILNLIIGTTLDEKDENYFMIQTQIWLVLGNQKKIQRTILKLLVERAVQFPISSPKNELLSNCYISMAASQSYVGEVLVAECLDSIKSALKAEKVLENHQSWEKIQIMSRFIALLCFDDKVHISTTLPDICCIMMLSLGAGSPLARRTVNAILMNVIHTLSLQENLGEIESKSLAIMTSKVSDPCYSMLFGLTTGEAGDKSVDSNNHVLDSWDADVKGSAYTVTPIELEFFADVLWDLAEISSSISGSRYIILGTSSFTRSRWISNFASVFEDLSYSSVDRGFFSIACAYRSDFDKEFFKKAVSYLTLAFSKYSEDTVQIIYSILVCLRSVIEKAPAEESIYAPIFLLSLGIAQFGHPTLFRGAIFLLQKLLKTIDDSLVTGRNFIKCVTTYKNELGQSGWQIGNHLKITSFETFSLYLISALLKGFNNQNTARITHAVVAGYLRFYCKEFKATAQEWTDQGKEVKEIITYVLTLLPSADSVTYLFDLSGLSYSNLVDSSGVFSETAQLILADQIFEIYASQSKQNLQIVACILLSLLENCKVDRECIRLLRVFLRMAEKQPQVLAKIYPAFANLSTGLASNFKNASLMLDNITKIMHSVQGSNTAVSVHAVLEPLGFAGLLLESTFQQSYKPDVMDGKAKALATTFKAIEDRI